jgi:N-acetylglucosamine-6-phosphate deacetylase
MTHTYTGRIMTPAGVVTGTLRFNDRIVAIEEHEAEGPYILPGFIDTHVHGGGGGDTMDGPEGVLALARFHVRHGTTTLYPTTMTNPWENVVRALQGVREVMQRPQEGLPDIPGAHLEGPFISPKRLGAQPPNTVEPTPERLEQVLALDVVRVVTLAPEEPGVTGAARRFAQAGTRVSIGHTVATFEQVEAAVKAIRQDGGVVGFTHLYNAMGGLAGREPGIVGAIFADAEAFAELIFDMHHVHPGSFRAAVAAKPNRVHLITDAIRATGLVEGETELGGQDVTVKNGAARLKDGTLAGSVLTLDQALRNAVAVGVPLEQVSRMLSAVPAAYMGLTDRGALAAGKRADLVVLSDALEMQEVFVGGNKVA